MPVGELRFQTETPDGKEHIVITSTSDEPAYYNKNIEEGALEPMDFELEADTDGDGVPDSQDAFPSDPDEWDDTDGDGTGNNADTDDDDDGMPDVWEEQYQGVLDPMIDDASAEPDEDDWTNLQEYQWGTHPDNAASRPAKAMPWLMLLLDD